MAKTKEIAIGKRAKISEAQQYTLLAVLGAALFLGAAIALNVHFVKKIIYQAQVVSAEDGAIVDYSNTIKNIGICKSPKGSTYSAEELAACSPDDINAAEVPGTLRYNIVETTAANSALNSVPKEALSVCRNPATSKNFTYDELNKLYNDATNAEERVAASRLLKSCSALRIIPDSLPAYKNDEALLSSLNKIFNESNWVPESLSPSGEDQPADFGTNLNEVVVNLSVESDMATTVNLINNMERSIRDFDISRATIEWSGDFINFQAQSKAYYVNKTVLSESSHTVPVEGQ